MNKIALTPSKNKLTFVFVCSPVNISLTRFKFRIMKFYSCVRVSNLILILLYYYNSENVIPFKTFSCKMLPI